MKKQEMWGVINVPCEFVIRVFNDKELANNYRKQEFPRSRVTKVLPVTITIKEQSNGTSNN